MTRWLIGWRDDLKITTPLIVIFFTISFVFNFWVLSEQQYTYLATSFLKGKLYFLEEYCLFEDTVLVDSKYYWPLGPFPAIILLPFTYIFSIFNRIFYQGYLQFFITCSVFYLSFRIARIFKFSPDDSLLLAFAFCFASVYQLVALMPWSWYFVQAIVVLLIFLSIFEYLRKRRYLIIGLIFSFIFASRFTAGFGVLFFIFDILTSKRYNFKKKAWLLVYLVVPIIISGILLLVYNYQRFGSILDNGYTRVNNHLLTHRERFKLLNYGLFRIRNIPTNFYYYFIKTLDPVLVNSESMHENTHFLKAPYVKVNYPGTSFFIVSPVFLYIFRTNLKKKIVKLSLVSALIILFFLLSYYWPGWRQVGPRYLLDLLPFLYLLLLNSFKNYKLSFKVKSVITFSSLSSFYLLLTVFGL
jgi:hypothetical protein